MEPCRLWGRPSPPFARSDLGQLYLNFSLSTGKTLRELGEMKRSDPELYEFYEEAFAERIIRLGDTR